jgi:hypothetical protein
MARVYERFTGEGGAANVILSVDAIALVPHINVQLTPRGDRPRGLVNGVTRHIVLDEAEVRALEDEVTGATAMAQLCQRLANCECEDGRKRSLITKAVQFIVACPLNPRLPPLPLVAFFAPSGKANADVVDVYKGAWEILHNRPPCSVEFSGFDGDNVFTQQLLMPTYRVLGQRELFNQFEPFDGQVRIVEAIRAECEAAGVPWAAADTKHVMKILAYQLVKGRPLCSIGDLSFTSESLLSVGIAEQWLQNSQSVKTDDRYPDKIFRVVYLNQMLLKLDSAKCLFESLCAEYEEFCNFCRGFGPEDAEAVYGRSGREFEQVLGEARRKVHLYQAQCIAWSPCVCAIELLRNKTLDAGERLDLCCYAFVAAEFLAFYRTEGPSQRTRSLDKKGSADAALNFFTLETIRKFSTAMFAHAQLVRSWDEVRSSACGSLLHEHFHAAFRHDGHNDERMATTNQILRRLVVRQYCRAQLGIEPEDGRSHNRTDADVHYRNDGNVGRAFRHILCGFLRWLIYEGIDRGTCERFAMSFGVDEHWFYNSPPLTVLNLVKAEAFVPGSETTSVQQLVTGARGLGQMKAFAQGQQIKNACRRTRRPV